MMKCDKCGAPVKFREQHPIGLAPRYDESDAAAKKFRELLEMMKTDENDVKNALCIIINNVLLSEKALNKTEILLTELIEAAKPFTSGYIVDETSSTVPMMETLKSVISKVEKYLSLP